MKEIIVKSLAETVGTLWKNLQAEYTKNSKFIVASPLSSTPLPIYEWIINNSSDFQNWDKMRFVLMDEQVDQVGSEFEYISKDDPASYERFAEEKFLKTLSERVSLANDFIIKPNLKHINDFDKKIDLLILALGIKGNYANVMPGTPVEKGWHIAHLSEEFKQIHTQKGSQSYEGALFREYGMSLGPKQVLEAKNVAVIISGEKKRDLTRELLSHSSFNPEFPLSIVYHPDVRDRVTIYMTKDVMK